MFKIMKNSDNVAAYVNEYIADTESDIANLPNDPKIVYPGSTCLVIETSSVYVLNSNGEWKKI